MDGMNANFPGGNATNMLQQMNYSSMQNIPNQSIPGPNINNLSNHVNSINNSNNNPADICNPKRQVVFDRLKKRMHNYRKRQGETVPRFDQTFNGICEQQSVETNVLQKRFIETKAKRVAKKADKKQTETAPSGNLSQSKQMKRSALDDLENDDVHPTAAKQMATSGDNMKFQVEIVQQLEFTTSAANMPQQISTNVTVKATTNGSLKYEPQEMKGMKMEPGKMQTMTPLPPPPPDILQDFKQEPDNEFADLDFGGIANFMANDENELKKLFSNISDVFDQDLFDQDKIKQEPRPTPPQQTIPQMPQQSMNQMNQIPQPFNDYVMPDTMQMQKPMMHQPPSQMQQQQQFNRMYQNVPQQQVQQPPQQQMPEMSPAAQTLKNMAQQHQVKSSMAMSYMRPPPMGGQQMMPQMNQQQPNPMQQRMPYQQQQQQVPQQVPPPQPQQQFNNDYSNQFNKSQMQMPFPPEMIKQEMMMQQQQQQPPQMQPMHQQQHQMKPVMNHQMMMGQNEEMKMNQQYQQYQNTQFVTNLPPQQQQQRNQFNPNQNSMNIHMKQTQMMHIQQNNNGNIQMQGAQHQHMHFAGDMKMGDNSNFSMQQQQNMYFNHHSQYGMQQALQKRPPQHHGDGPNNNFNMMQSQQMSFTQ